MTNETQTTEAAAPSTKVRVEIKSRWTGEVLYGAEVERDEEHPLREIVVRAVAAGAYLDGAYLARANLDGANLSGANLSGAYLAGANLDGANLARAYLAGAYLARANLDGAYLDGANLAGANLAGAYLDGAYLAGWLLDFARLGACGSSLVWLARCSSPGTALIALCGEWRSWLEDKGAPIADGAPAVLAWAAAEVAKLPPLSVVKVEAGDLEKFLPGEKPTCNEWLTCSCSAPLRGRIWLAKTKALREGGA